MNKVLGAVICGALMVAAILFVVALLLVKVLWAWTIPDLFPGAVEQGLVAGTISWLTAVKIALFIAVLAAFTRPRRIRKQSGDDVFELSI